MSGDMLLLPKPPSKILPCEYGLILGLYQSSTGIRLTTFPEAGCLASI